MKYIKTKNISTTVVGYTNIKNVYIIINLYLIPFLQKTIIMIIYFLTILKL